MKSLIRAAVLSLITVSLAHGQCPGDVVPNGVVNGVDLAEVLANWGSCSSCAADTNGDGQVNGVDLAGVLGGWGPCRPVITSVSPNVGTIAGGTPITITGNYFLGTTSVTVGGAAATSVHVVSATTLSAVTPAGPVGAAAVAVIANGRSGALSGAYTYSDSSISSVVPNVGAAVGGFVVTITGAFLQNTSAVWFGESPALSFAQTSPTQVTAMSPPGEVGTSVDVRLQTPAGLLVAPGAFSYVSIVVPEWATLLEATPDPTVVTSESLRSAINSTGYAWRVRDTVTQIELVLVPPGTYQRADCQVTLTQPFYMGRYEVTQAQWTARMGSNPSHFWYASAAVPAHEVPLRPVETISWNMIQEFLAGTGMRLPTEAEWEYAYRAGTTTAFHSMPGYPDGTDDASLVGNIAWWGYPCCGGNSGDQTRPVGGKAGNGLGLHDMSGNVYEWVHDWWDEYPSAAQVDPTGPASGTTRVARGGSSWAAGWPLTSSGRWGFMPEVSYFGFGFRVARNP